MTLMSFQLKATFWVGYRFSDIFADADEIKMKLVFSIKKILQCK